jgi:mercuric ion binding protein
MAWLVMVFLLRDLRVNRLRPGICCTVAASGGLCEGEKFQEIVGGADHGPLGTYFLNAAQQELAEAACLFDLSEHRLHHLLSQSVRRVVLNVDNATWELCAPIVKRTLSRVSGVKTVQVKEAGAMSGAIATVTFDDAVANQPILLDFFVGPGHVRSLCPWRRRQGTL